MRQTAVTLIAQCGLPIFFADSFRCPLGDDASIVEQDVEATKFGQGMLDNTGASPGVGMIRLEKAADASQSRDNGNDFLAAIPPASRNHNFRAFLCKQDGGCSSNTGSSARNEGDAMI
jgi:hypothetical protein